MEEKYLLAGLIAVLAVILVFGIFSILQTNYGARYQKAVQSELGDICATPPGYTDEQWREHMGHHPDRYAQCLS